MNKPRNILAVIIATLPGFLLLLWMRMIDKTTMGIFEMMIYPLAFGGALIVLILILNKYLCRTDIASFNSKSGSISKDILYGFVLLAIFIVLTILEQFTLMRWLPVEGPPPEIQELIGELSQNPLLMIIWLGPVVWIGVGIFEELYRAFFLKSLWEIWDRGTGKWIVILISAGISGAVHSYQGAAGVISTGIMGAISALFYMKYRRFWPLVIAHSLYDSAWIVFGVYMSH